MRARDNPFATDRVLRLRYRLPSWPAFLDRLELMSYRGAIVGPEGSGKTTLLEDLAPHLEARGYRVVALFLNQEVRKLRVPRLDGRTIVLLDGAEQLSRVRWWWLRAQARHTAGLIVTSHQPGLLPTLIDCRTSVELVGDLLRELTGEDAQAFAPRARELFAEHDGNVRDVFRALYDVCSRDRG